MNDYASIIVANTLLPDDFVRCDDDDFQSLLNLASEGQCAGMLWTQADPMEVIAGLVESGVTEMSLIVLHHWPAVYFDPASFPTESDWTLALMWDPTDDPDPGDD